MSHDVHILQIDRQSEVLTGLRETIHQCLEFLLGVGRNCCVISKSIMSLTLVFFCLICDRARRVVDQSALVSPFRIVCMLKVGSASGRQVSPVIPEVSRRCDVTPEVETVTYRVYRVLSQQVCVLDKR